MHPLKSLAAAAVALGLLPCLTGSSRADEGAAGQYIMGAYASVVDVTPNTPGLAAASDFYFYTGSVGGNRRLPFGGLLATNLNANVYFVDVSLAYTFRPTLLGAHYTLGVAIPYVWMDIEAKSEINPRFPSRVIGARNRTVRDGANGVSDLALVPVALNWTFGDLQINPQFVVFAPTGDYATGQLANPGKNHWMFDTILGLSYLSHKTGTEFTLFGGYAISTENPDTHYRNGDAFHLEATLQQYLPLNKQTLLGIGVNGFYYRQVTGDSGSGAVLGGFEGTDAGVGPVLTLIHKTSKSAFSAQVKWLPELRIQNRLTGDSVWFSVGMQF